VHDRLIAESPFTNIKLPRVYRERVEPVTVEQSTPPSMLLRRDFGRW
jgi:hypothetical protein